MLKTEHNAHKSKSPRPFYIFQPTQRWLHAIQCVPKLFFRKRASFGRKLGKNGQTLEARTRRLWGVEPRNKAICKVETTKDIVDGLVDLYNLVFYFKIFRPVSTRAIQPLCTRAHMQALMTRVGGDNLTIVCIFEGTYYGPTPKVFTHIFAPQGPKDMFTPRSPAYALFPINSVLQGLRC